MTTNYIRISRIDGLASLAFDFQEPIFLSKDMLGELVPHLENLLQLMQADSDPGLYKPVVIRGTEDEVAPPVKWTVLAVSANHGSFGHKGVLVANADKGMLKLTPQAFGSTPLPQPGDELDTIPSSEVPPEQMVGPTPERLREFIEEARAYRQSK
jgi:hypothetical protein